MKLVPQLDSNGVFIGATVADESPLEPGVFLIPGGAIDEVIPEIPGSHQARWTGQWVIEPTPVLHQDASENTPSPDASQMPISVTRRQAFLALLSAGLLDQIESYMALETTPRVVKITWETALDFKRDNPLLLAIAQELGLPDSQLDSLFELARTL